MTNFKYFTTFILVFGFIGCECADKKLCHEHVISYEWQHKNNSQPATINAIGLFRHEFKSYGPYANTISIRLTERQENLNLTLLVKPYVENRADCPPDPNGEFDLRKFHKQYRWEMDGRHNITFVFPKAFTGCYYFIMTNDRNQHWLTALKHYKTDQVYFDTMLQCKVQHVFQHTETSCSRIRLNVLFRIARRCLKLKINLFELEDNNPDTLKKCQSNEIPAKKVCSLTLENCNGTKANVNLECESSEATDLEALQLFGSTCEMDGSWKVDVYWTGLNTTGAYYYYTFSQEYICDDARYSDLNVWIPATKLDMIDHDWKNDTECISPEIAEQNFDFRIIYIPIAVILILILIYYIGRLIRNGLYHNKFSWKQSNIIISVPEEEWKSVIDKSTDILLVYARDSDDFKKAVDHLRGHLEEKCSYQIRDIYSNNELQNVSKLTVPVWIERMMRSRCKIVWIDTPKFRSRLNDDILNEENLHNDGGFDFRDTSVRYAVNLAKTTFENTTQYRRHFVLRINGFDEFNGVEDPLFTITPHVRYHYPEHFDKLCKHLNK